MTRLLGCGLILAGGLLARRELVGDLRGELALLAELLAGLEALGQEIRLCRTPLPEALAEPAGLPGGAGAFFSAVRTAALRGRSAADAWRSAAAALALPREDRAALERCAGALSGDEEALLGALDLVRERLERSLSEKHRERADREKRATALSLSAAALAVILLM